MRKPGRIRFFRAGNVNVVEKDLSPEGISWESLPRFIEGFKKIYPGYDFRLPTMNELRYLYSLKREGIGNFKERYYWASELVKEEMFYSLDFDSGDNYVLRKEEFNNELYYFRVRLVVGI